MLEKLESATNIVLDDDSSVDVVHLGSLVSVTSLKDDAAATAGVFTFSKATELHLTSLPRSPHTALSLGVDEGGVIAMPALTDTTIAGKAAKLNLTIDNADDIKNNIKNDQNFEIMDENGSASMEILDANLADDKSVSDNEDALHKPVSNQSCSLKSRRKNYNNNNNSSTSEKSRSTGKNSKKLSIVSDFYALDYVVELIASKLLPARIDYLSQELIFERLTEAQQIEKKNVENVAKMASSVKFMNQLVVFVNELET